MIRYADKNDITNIIELSREFYYETESDRYYGFDTGTIRFVLLVAVSNNHMITDGEHGVFLFNIYPSFYDLNELILSEIFFYVRKDIGEMRRGRIAYQLLKRIDDEAEARGIRHISINNLIRYKNEKVDRLYKRFGYQHRENSYMKEV